MRWHLIKNNSMNKLLIKHKYSNRARISALKRFRTFLTAEVPTMIFPGDVNMAFSHNAYERFIGNFMVEMRDAYRRPINNADEAFMLLSQYSPDQFVSRAFTWGSTPERYIYWATISHAWVGIVQRERL